MEAGKRANWWTCALRRLEAGTARRKPVELKLSEVRRILGATLDAEGITAAMVEGVLKALGCGLAGLAGLARSEGAGRRTMRHGW